MHKALQELETGMGIARAHSWALALVRGPTGLGVNVQAWVCTIGRYMPLSG